MACTLNKFIKQQLQKGHHAAFLTFLFILMQGCTKAVLNGAESVASNAVSSSAGISLTDDTTNSRLRWSSNSVIKANIQSFTINGACTPEIGSVQVLMNNQNWSSARCGADGKFSVPFTNTKKIPSNGAYTLMFLPVASGSPLISSAITKTYDYYKVDGSTLASFDSLPNDTTNANVDLVANCARAVSFTINSASFTCTDNDTLNMSIPLSLGTNVLNYAWVDDYGNDYSGVLSIYRNEAGTPVIVSAAIVASYTYQIADTNPAVTSPYMENILASQFIQGSYVDNRIPYSIADSSGSGLGFSLTPTNSMYYCLNQSPLGACVP